MNSLYSLISLYRPLHLPPYKIQTVSQDFSLVNHDIAGLEANHDIAGLEASPGGNRGHNAEGAAYLWRFCGGRIMIKIIIYIRVPKLLAVVYLSGETRWGRSTMGQNRKNRLIRVDPRLTIESAFERLQSGPLADYRDGLWLTIESAFD